MWPHIRSYGMIHCVVQEHACVLPWWAAHVPHKHAGLTGTLCRGNMQAWQLCVLALCLHLGEDSQRPEPQDGSIADTTACSPQQMLTAPCRKHCTQTLTASEQAVSSQARPATHRQPLPSTSASGTG
jgi:hypothetical protein